MIISYLAEGSECWSSWIWGGTGAARGASGRPEGAWAGGRVCGSGGSLSGGVGGGVGNSTVSWSRWAGRAGAVSCCGRGDKGEGTGSLLSAASTSTGDLLGDLHNTTNTQGMVRRDTLLPMKSFIKQLFSTLIVINLEHQVSVLQ